MEKLNNYQICFVATDGKQTKCAGVENVTAESLAAAYLFAQERHDTETFFVYPLAVLPDPDDKDNDGGASIYELAKYCCKQFWKWELRNNNAVLSALNRSTWDKEDERQEAACAILATLADGANNMFEPYHKAMAALSASRDKLFRKNEHEYNPNALFTNPFTEYIAKATYPELAALIKRAKEKTELTEKQAEILEAYERGIAPSDIQAQLEIAKQSYYQHYYSAMFKILRSAVEMDGETLPTFAQSGLDSADVAEAVLAYAKRARVKLDEGTLEHYTAMVEQGKQ